MDGLSISNIQNTIGGVTETATRSREIKTPQLPNLDKGEKTFLETLKDAVGNVNELQKKADVQMQKLSTGKAENIPDVLIATEQADIALKLMVQVRNKIIDAYNDIMKMQV